MTDKATKETGKETGTTSAKPGADAPTTFDLTLDDFCRGLSASRQAGPELLGGFHHACVVAGRTKCSEADFQAAFAAFAIQPA